MEKRQRGRPRLNKPGESPAIVQALDRGLGLLQCLAKEREASLTNLSILENLPISTVHRLLVTFQKHGFVEFLEEGQKWVIGVESFRVGSSFAHRTKLIDVGQTVLRSLTDKTGETANIAILYKGQVVFISQVETYQTIRAFFAPGTRSTMHSSGIGKAILSTLRIEDIEDVIKKHGLSRFTEKTLTSPESLSADLVIARTRGWALDDEERHLGMRCVAAPIYNSFGEAFAGVSVSGPTARMNDEAIQVVASRVMQAAGTITQKIGGEKPNNSG
jgi:IclR family acetate operon transcriptional repressor